MEGEQWQLWYGLSCWANLFIEPMKKAVVFPSTEMINLCMWHKDSTVLYAPHCHGEKKKKRNLSPSSPSVKILNQNRGKSTIFSMLHLPSNSHLSATFPLGNVCSTVKFLWTFGNILMLLKFQISVNSLCFPFALVSLHLFCLWH